jgi:hypothetical protein
LPYITIFDLAECMPLKDITVVIFVDIVKRRSWDSSVGLGKGYELDGPGSIPGSARFIFLLYTNMKYCRGETNTGIR